MPKMYLMHKTRTMVGYADLPEWINFDEVPPRGFGIRWKHGGEYEYPCTTLVVVPITEEVYDLSPSEPYHV